MNENILMILEEEIYLPRKDGRPIHDIVAHNIMNRSMFSFIVDCRRRRAVN